VGSVFSVVKNFEMQYYGIDWLATVCGLTGVYLLGNKSKIGFLLFMLASSSWAVFGIMTGSIAMTIGSTIFFSMHLRGFLAWRRDERKNGFLETQEIKVAK
jgi:hypothetical protein